MWTYLPDLAAENAPRYTSYPTAAEFHDGVGISDQRAALARLTDGSNLGLYVHIPYCDRICWYCGCNTGRAGDDGRVSRYADALLAEIDIVASLARGRVSAIHFGGGSPNALSPETFSRLMAHLRDRFDVRTDADIALELDPRTLTDAFAAAMAIAGTSRVSIGAQTFAPHVQSRIGRVQPFGLVVDRVAAIRRAGIGQVNLDLMYGLPRQMAVDVAETIRLTLTLRPDRVAMFGYAHLPGMLARQRMIRDAELPGPAERFAQARLAHDRLTAGGLIAVGFDHFARAGDSLAEAARIGRLRRNFQGFTGDTHDALIGFGASAISELPGLLVQNEKNAGQYRTKLLGGHLAGSRGVARGPEDMLRGAVIEQLLCKGVADIGAICTARGMAASHLDAAFSVLEPLVEAGVAAVDGRMVRVMPNGLPYARLVARAFDIYRARSASRFSKAV